MPRFKMKDLNPKQQQAVSYNKGPLLILAGAGSGKTRVLTYKAGFLILQGKIDPQSILLVTFTNKAALEMKDRIKNLLTTNISSPTLPYAGTFHSFCAKVLRIDGKHIGISPNYLIYDQKDQLDLVKNVMNLLDISQKNFKPASILTTISSAKNELIESEDYKKYARGYFQKTVAEIFPLYQQLLNKYEALDFDDLILKTVGLFRKETFILEKYQNRYQHILVDEYHDTNHAQYILTKLISLKSKNITVVADCSQSIYGWRGADFRNVLNLKNDFPQLKTINLEQNYRSSDNILKAAFSVIKQNTSHPVLNLWTNNLKGEKIKIYEAASEKDEAKFIIDQILMNLSLVSKPNYSKFAVLYRTNAQSRIFEEAFLHAGIPYILIGGVRFYDRKEIKDCIAYLRIFINPKDRISYLRLEKIGKRRLDKFLLLADKLKNKKITTFKLLTKILKATDYWDLYDKKDEQDLARVENIKELFSVAREFPNLHEFLENTALVEQENLSINQALAKKGNKKNAVTLMTMHAAKGLEFDTVFMVGMEEGLFPHSRSILEKEKLEEERRLAYVGITRAKKKLFLSFSRKRLYFGNLNFNQVSRFITEISSNLLQFIYHDSSRSL
ncbi:ATP-dependent helicase [Patescibacteria group bacterium]